MPVADLTPAMRASLEHQGETWVGILGKAGPLADLFLPYYTALTERENVLGFKMTELIRLAVATTTGCEACLEYRDPRALKEGMDPNVVSLFDELDQADFTPRERAALRFALMFCTNHHKVDEALWDELKGLFNDAEIMTLCLFVATYLGTGRLAHTMRLIDAHCTVPGYRLSPVVEAKRAQNLR